MPFLMKKFQVLNILSNILAKISIKQFSNNPLFESQYNHKLFTDISYLSSIFYL